MAESYQHNYVLFEDVYCEYDSGLAICCVIEGEEVWIPKKLIHDDSEVYKKETDGNLIIPEWFATEKELI